MTVTYGDKSFIRLLFRWRGSIWKSVAKHYLVFLVLYFAIQLAYRFALPADKWWGKQLFERYVLMFDKWNDTIPITFLLGFYVSNVVNRWWSQLNQVSWPDKFLVFLTANLNEEDLESRVLRRTFARYMNLMAVMVWKEISLKIKKRFPTNYHLVKAGLMTEEEFELFEGATSTHGRWFLPVSWTVNLLAKCKKERRISEYTMKTLLDLLYGYRSTAGMLTMYDWITIPLVYTQLVTIATYGYFLVCLIARQSIRDDAKGINKHAYIDIYLPLFTTLEFLFYVGWLKVGEELRSPFGENDEDFNMNYVLDRNIHVSNMLVDELVCHRPTVVEDVFLNDKHPALPHTKASYKVRDGVPDWRLATVNVPDEEYEWYDANNEAAKLDDNESAKPGPQQQNITMVRINQ